tara:strand:- start:138 stop:374 length:237 start_codon:yes stop_codon:yes gene_type:complete
MEAIANIIVNLLKLIKTRNATKHNKIEYNKDRVIEIFPEAIGRFFVRVTLLSKSLSIISLTIHPAERIKTDPEKNKNK